MSEVIREGNLEFSFADGADAVKYDEWSFYRDHLQSACGGTKGVDILCLKD